MGAARLGESYVGLVSGAHGNRVVQLSADNNGQLTLGAERTLGLPADFILASIGIIDGELALGGGSPFVWSVREVDDSLDPSVRAAMDRIPPDMPTEGTRRVERVGVRPELYVESVSGPSAVELPDQATRRFGIVEAIDGSEGHPLVLIGHTDVFHDSWCRSAGDAVHLSGPSPVVEVLARDLAENQPLLIAVSNGVPLYVQNTVSGVVPSLQSNSRLFTSPGEGAARAAASLPNGFAVGLFSNGIGGVWRFNLADQSWDGEPLARLESMTDFIPVAGALGEMIIAAGDRFELLRVA